MKYSMLYDTHTHSEHSFDGKDSCTRLCDGAVRNGLKGLAVTDHLDIDGDDPDIRSFTLNQYTQCCKAREVFRGKLEVLCGLELGQGIYRREQSEKVLAAFDYDFILGSLHNLEKEVDFYYMDFRKEDVNARLEAYFKDLLTLAQWDRTDSLAHITYPLRYIVGKYGIEVDLSPYDDTIGAIFETLIKNRKALELNASSLFNYHHDTMPGKAYIRRFYEMGGKYVTVGSDSHYAERVGYGVDTCYDILWECGFRQFTVFRKREPFLIDIE